MARAEGPLRARFWVCILGGAALGMIVGLIQTVRPGRTALSSEYGIPGLLIGGAVVGASVGWFYWFKRLWTRE